MAYGSGTSYTVRVYQNSVSCGNRDFVDPIFGVEKACYLSVSTTTAALSSTTTTPTPTTTATGTNTSTATGTNTNTATGSNTNTATGTNTTGGSTTTPPPTTTTTNGAISLRLAASRVTGTAPLAVHFDASDTTTTIAGVQPFHDIRYEFNFGDDRGQNWTISGLSKNTQTG